MDLHRLKSEVAETESSIKRKEKELRKLLEINKENVLNGKPNGNSGENGFQSPGASDREYRAANRGGSRVFGSRNTKIFQIIDFYPFFLSDAQNLSANASFSYFCGGNFPSPPPLDSQLVQIHSLCNSSTWL